MGREITGLAVLALALGMADGAAAQERGRDRDEERRDRQARVEQHRSGDRIRESIILGDRDRRRVRVDRSRVRVDRRYRAGRGPSFCRSGAGHPVWGRRWCLEKGFGLGRRHDRFDRRRVKIGRSLPEIIFGRRYWDPGHRYRRAVLGQAELGDILGLVARDYILYEVLGLSPYDGRRISARWRDTRFHDRRHTAYWQAGYRSPAHANALALELLLGGERVAELADLDRDGVVDVLLTGR